MHCHFIGTEEASLFLNRQFNRYLGGNLIKTLFAKFAALIICVFYISKFLVSKS